MAGRGSRGRKRRRRGTTSSRRRDSKRPSSRRHASAADGPSSRRRASAADGPGSRRAASTAEGPSSRRHACPPKVPSAGAAPAPPNAPAATAAPSPPKAPVAAAAPPTPKAPEAAGAPPPPAAASPPPKASENQTGQLSEWNLVMKKCIQKMVLALGCVISISSFCYPIVVIWSVGGNVSHAADFYTKPDLGATSLSTIAWLMFAICELHVDDGKIVGAAAVISNAVGVAFIGMTILMKVTRGQHMNTRDCLGAYLGFAITFTFIIFPSVFGPVEKDGQWAKIFSFIAAVFQLVSQLLPLHTAYRLFWPADGAEQQNIMNFKKLLIVSRGYGTLISSHWALYCLLTYQHSLFMIINVISTLISYFTLFVHVMYCLKPVAPAPAEVQN